MKTTGSLINTSIDDLSERIEVVRPRVARNQYGDVLKTAEEIICRVWAKVLPINSRINDNVPERMNKISYRIIIRYREDVKPDDEIFWRRRRLKIITPPYDAESRRIFTVFDCEEVIEDGQT